MNDENLAANDGFPQKALRSAYLALGALVSFIITAVVIVVHLVELESERDLRSWRIQMGIIADAQSLAVEKWISQQYTVLTGLARNTSLQLYMSRLQSNSGDLLPEDLEGVEKKYLQNLLEVTAYRTGFSGRLDGPDVRANVGQKGVSGLAILDVAGSPLSTTAIMPPITEDLANQIRRIERTHNGLIDIYSGPAGTPTMAFVVPVFSIHEEHTETNQIGLIVGVKEVMNELFSLLERPGSTFETEEGFLVRQVGNSIEYVSPLKELSSRQNLSIEMETPDLASSFAIQNSGSFSVRHDYRNQEVLVTGRKVANTPWTYIHKIDTAEALATSNARLRTISYTGALLTVLVILAVIAVWRWGTSVRVERSLDATKEALKKHQELAQFLSVLADNQPTEIFAITQDGRYFFANKAAAENAGTLPDDMLGKEMISIIGPIKSKSYMNTIQEVVKEQKPRFKTYTFEASEGRQFLQVGHVPLPGDQNYPPGVLVVANDVTGILMERERRELASRQFIRMLAVLVDQKDPYSMLHTAFVVEVALGIAREMELSDEEIETINLASISVNLGKIFVSKEILLKESSLTDDETEIVEQAQISSVDLLEGIGFDVPVREALAQLKERWDGEGSPLGLKGEDIMIASRVVAVANAFVAIISDRAYRKSILFDLALEMLFAEAGSKYDRKIVIALAHYLENRGGKELLIQQTDVDQPDVISQLNILKSINK